MKLPLVRLFEALLLLSSLAPPAQAATYETSKGAVFTQVTDTDFGLTWREPDQDGAPGKVWSAYLGDYDNEALQPDDSSVRDDHGGWLITESHATLVCKKVNGRLPTTQDYDRLRTYFEIGGGGLLSPQGRTDIRSLFPDMADHWFWTSMSTGPDDTNRAQGFNGFTGFVDYYGTTRDALRGVRCIH